MGSPKTSWTIVVSRTAPPPLPNLYFSQKTKKQERVKDVIPCLGSMPNLVTPGFASAYLMALAAGNLGGR